MYPVESLARKMMIEISRRMQVRGFLGSNDVNLSWRIERDLFITLATGVFADNIDDNSILTMNFAGEVLQSFGPYTPSRDAGMHIQIYKQHPDVLGVINAQTPYATLCSVAGKSLDYGYLPKTVFDLGVLPLVPYAEPGSKELEERVAKACVGHNGLLLQNRGPLVWGMTLPDALTQLELAEQAAFLSWKLGFSGEYALGDQEIGSLLAQRKVWDIKTGGVPRSRTDKK
jgi:L-fuculose-phosphate aldolase